MAAMNKWKKFGLYLLIALFLYMIERSGRPGPSLDPAGRITYALGGYFGCFLLVAIVGEVIVSINRRSRRSKPNQPISSDSVGDDRP
jgi:hypothetical protein